MVDHTQPTETEAKNRQPFDKTTAPVERMPSMRHFKKELESDPGVRSSLMGPGLRPIDSQAEGTEVLRSKVPAPVDAKRHQLARNGVTDDGADD